MCIRDRDVDVMTQAFKEFSAKTVKQKEKQSLKQKLSRSREQSKAQHKEKVKVKTKDRGVGKIMLPLGGMLTCIFVGTRDDNKVLKAELTNEGTLKFRLFGAYVFFMKYVAPIAIGIVFLNELEMCIRDSLIGTRLHVEGDGVPLVQLALLDPPLEIGRASCRERV